MIFLKAMLLLLFLIQPVAAFDNNNDWKLVKQENDIKVYTRNLDYSSYKEFRGEMNLRGDITDLLAFINNAELCPRWRYKCINMLSLNDGYIYKLSDLPWPLNDRYTVMFSQLAFDAKNNSYTLYLKNIPKNQLPRHIRQQLPKLDSSVQMRYSDGFWQIKLLESDHIHIIYQMHGDPAGIIPAALANQGVTNAAFITLSNLKKQFPAWLNSSDR